MDQFETLPEVQITAQLTPEREPDLDDDIPKRSETLPYFTQYRGVLFSPWNLIVACTIFSRDFPDDVPADLIEASLTAAPIVGKVQDELYTDLLEARAENRLPELLAEIREFIEEGV